MLKERIMKDIENNKIREGTLQKRSKYLKQWRQRWIVLTFNFLISFKSRDCKEISEVIEISTIENYKSYINTTSEMVPAAFKIKSGDNLMYLCAKDAEEKWSWMVVLERLLDYRVNGATKYNNLTFIKTMGFKSLTQFTSAKDYLSMSKESEQFQFQGSNAKDQETLIMMKEIFKKQEQLKKEKEIMRKEKKLLKKQIQEFESIRAKNPQVFHSMRAPKKLSLNFNGSFTTANNNEQLTSIRQQDEEEIHYIEVVQPKKQPQIKQQDSRTVLEVSPPKREAQQSTLVIKKPNKQKQTREMVVYGILEEFSSQSQIIYGLKYFIEFIASLCSDEKLGYSEIILSYLKNHKNKEFFLEIFAEITESYDSYTNFNIISILIKRLLQQKISLPHSYHPILLKKVLAILFTIENESKEQILTLLKIIHELSGLMKIDREEQLLLKLNKFSRLSKKEEIRNLSKTLMLIVEG